MGKREKGREVHHMDLVEPALRYLASYVDALKRGWSPDASAEGAQRLLERIADDREGFLATERDPHRARVMVTLPDGKRIPCPPGVARWIWNGEFCGRIWLRWSGYGVELPRYWLGHVAYEVVPWKQRRGYATNALRQILPEARSLGLPYIDVVADIENVASQRVILSNGGVLIDRLDESSTNGGGEALRFRIAL